MIKRLYIEFPCVQIECQQVTFISLQQWDILSEPMIRNNLKKKKKQDGNSNQISINQ